MSAPDQKSRRAARRFAARDGISYTAARRMLLELGLWGRGSRFYDELLDDLDAREVSLRDLVGEARGEAAKLATLPTATGVRVDDSEVK